MLPAMGTVPTRGSVFCFGSRLSTRVCNRIVAVCLTALTCALPTTPLLSSEPTARVLSGETEFRSFGFCLDGHTIAATDGKTSRLIDWPSGTARSSIVDADDQPPCVLVALGSSPDGKWWAAAAPDGSVVIRDAAAKTTARVLSADVAETNAVAFSPDGSWLASGGADNDVHVWDARSWRPVATVSTLTHATFGVAWSPDSKVLYLAGVSRAVTALSSGTWTQARASTPQPFVLTHVAVSPDGRTIATGGFDPRSAERPAAIRLFDASTLVERASVPTASGIRGLAFSPDGKSVLAVVSRQKGILVWPVE